MGTKNGSGVAPRTSAPVPSYPVKIVGGLALSLSMGLAASCGGDPGIYRYDAMTVADARLAAAPEAGPPDASEPGPDGHPDAGVDAPVVDGGAGNLDGAGQ